MTTVSKGMERKRPRMGLPTRGPMHLWRTVDPDIPRQVASPQSLTAFLRAKPYISLVVTSLQTPLDTVAMPQKIHSRAGKRPGTRFSRMSPKAFLRSRLSCMDLCLRTLQPDEPHNI